MLSPMSNNGNAPTKRLKLPVVKGDLGEALAELRGSLAEQLLLEQSERAFSFSVEDDDGGYGAPAWSDISGHLCVSRDTAQAMTDGDEDAIAAIAHQLVHAIGSGPAFLLLEEQLLEEAAVEIIAQCYSSAFLEAFGLEAEDPPTLFLVENGDVEVERPTAANIAVERFARIAAWLEGLDGDADPDEIEEAALKWAIKIKSMPPANRFPALAVAAAELGADDKSQADEWDFAAAEIEDYLRGYMKQLTRSKTGFDGLEYALRRAWLDDAEKPAKRVPEASEWRDELEAVERVTMLPLPKKGAIEKALAVPVSEEVAAVIRRSLDVRSLLWSARNADAASI